MNRQVVFGLIAVNIVMLVLGQLLWKTGLLASGGLRWDNAIRVFLSPWTLGGVAMYAVATVVWLVVLSNAPLSLAYPLQALAYLIGVLSAQFTLHEGVSFTRWIGVLLIVSGAFLVAFRD